MNTKEQWEEDIQKRVNDIAYSHPKSGKEATENRNKILEIIRETREQSYEDGRKYERERIIYLVNQMITSPMYNLPIDYGEDVIKEIKNVDVVDKLLDTLT